MADTDTAVLTDSDTSTEKTFRLPQNSAELIPLRSELSEKIASIEERISRAQIQLADARGRLARVCAKIEEDKANGVDVTTAAKKLIADRQAEIDRMKAEFGLS